MLNFRPLLPEDSVWLRPVLQSTDEIPCDNSPGCMVMWGNASIAACGDFFVPMVTYDGKSVYLRPAGAGDFSAILPDLIEDSRERGIPFRMYGITESVRVRLAQTQELRFVTDRANSDYLYTIESLTTLAGRKLQSKRNHINRFQAEYPDAVCEPITRGNIPECEEMAAAWYYEHYETGADPAFFDGERRAIATGFDHYETFGFDGLLIRVDGRVVAFSFGMPLNRTTFDVNFEKAFSNMPGAYALINREFARLVQKKYPDVKYLNREDDMGSEGLRKAKLSYQPEIILDKYTACLSGETPCE